jgi:RNA polymerase sigma factor (sigma-70 family)
MPDLVQRWVTGDAEAGEALYRAYFARVRSFIATRGVKDVDAEDIAQEALIAGLEGLRGGAQPDQLTGWIMGIAKHIQARRTRLLLKDLESIDPRQRSAPSRVIRKEMDDVLHGTLKSLSGLDRQVLELAHRSGLSRKEIAERLDVEVKAIHSRMERVEGKLREALSRHFTTLALGKLERRGVSLDQIEGLRPLFRDPVILRHLEELPEEMAARRLGVPVTTLRARLRSAYELLGSDEAPDFAKARAESRKRHPKGPRPAT